MTTNSELSGDDKLIAALAYWGSLIFWSTGLLFFLPPLVIYLWKKDSSPYIRRHALQSLGLNIALLIVGTICGILVTVIGVITLGLGALLMIPVMILIGLAAAIYLIVLGYQVFQGTDVDIPYLTPLMQKHIGL